MAELDTPLLLVKAMWQAAHDEKQRPVVAELWGVLQRHYPKYYAALLREVDSAMEPNWREKIHG